MTAGRIVIVDYGMGNLHSMAKALEHVAQGTEIVVSDDPVLIRGADKVVFPGVGAMRDCMAELVRRGLDRAVCEAAATLPLLAVCIGMQALMDSSDENNGSRAGSAKGKRKAPSTPSASTQGTQRAGTSPKPGTSPRRCTGRRTHPSGRPYPARLENPRQNQSGKT